MDNIKITLCSEMNTVDISTDRQMSHQTPQNICLPSGIITYLNAVFHIVYHADRDYSFRHQTLQHMHVINNISVIKRNESALI